MLDKELVKSILQKVAIALFLTLFFGVIALIQPVGQKVNVHVYSVDKQYEYVGSSELVFAIVEYNANASFNPFLYPISWLTGKGYMSGNFSMIYLPHWVGGYTGDASPSPRWGKPKEIEGEAAMKLVLEEFLINLPILPAVFFAIELLNQRRVYWWFLGGTGGFVFGAIIGVIAGFFFLVFMTNFMWPKWKNWRSKRDLADKIQISQ